MKKRLIIFGIGIVAKMAKFYFDTDSDYEVVAFTLDKEFIDAEMLDGLPILDFSTIATKFPVTENEIFIAIGHSKMNVLRESKYLLAKQKGFKIASYISSKCMNLSQLAIGENTLVMEGTIIQPLAKIGNNVIIWSGSVIGHGSVVEDHNFLSIHVVVCGYATVKKNCFVGANATIADFVTVAEKTLVGAHTFISKNTEEGSVYAASRAVRLNKKSDEINL